MKKRLLAVVLCLCMAVGMVPILISAASAEVISPEDSPIRITKTNIKADSVFNTGGYGSLKINGNWSDWDGENEDDLIPPQVALINRSGTFVFPYQEDSNENFYADGARFRYSDGIVSLTLGSAHDNGDLPKYYYLNGSAAFTLKETENEYTDENGVHHNDSTSYLGGPMTDGYAVLIKKLYSSWNAGIAGGGSSSGDNVTQIINRKGEVTCELPAEFNEYLDWGAGGFSTKRSLGWCGEGLFAFFEHTVHEDWNFTTEGLGYMDPTGKTVIDLAGRGYTNLFPFHEGLAAVKDQAGKVGFINKSGALVIPCVYEAKSEEFTDGLCAVKKDGKWGYIDKTGNVVIPFAYDGAYGAGAGLASVVKDGKCGLVDYSNNAVVPLEYDDISSYADGAAYGIKNGVLYLFTDYITKQPTTPTTPTTPTQPTNPTAPTFTDVPANEYYAGAVKWAVEKGITNGTTKTTFSPDQTCTQVQILTLLYRTARGDGTASAEDLNKAVSWAREKGMIDASFNENAPCTRATAVKFIWQAFDSPDAESSSFKDVTGGYADAVNWAVANGVTNGTGGGNFSPNDTCTRGQIVTFLHRAYVPSAALKH